MVGFLVAGFVLNFLGARSGVFLREVADLGVTLLLFTIGLKLRLNTLVRPEIWATTALHMVSSVLITAGFIWVLSFTGFLLFGGIEIAAAGLIAFALSFSSTVFAVKFLDDRGATTSRYGQVAIGVLVIQDIAAVVFLAASTGKLPSLWALALLSLIPLRHLLGLLLEKSGHRELLVVLGFAIALGGSSLFETVGMKGDLGALIMGILLAQHPRADELSKTLLNFKDVFLVCFFLAIGLTGLPTWDFVLSAAALLILIPFKLVLFFLLLSRFRLRARGATLGAGLLGTYSEFGLIVVAIAISANWLHQDWLVVVALAVSASFVIASPFNVFADTLYARFAKFLNKFETDQRLAGDETISLRGHKTLIFGMGRVGRSAYDQMSPHMENQILGIDMDEDEVEKNIEQGRHTVMGDATDPEFWTRLDQGYNDVEMILLAMPHHKANMDSAKRFREMGYDGPIVATALYADQEEDLKECGVDEVFDLYAEAGSGAASRMWNAIKSGDIK